MNATEMAMEERTISQINANFLPEWWHWEGQSWPSGPFGGTLCSTHLQDYGAWGLAFLWVIGMCISRSVMSDSLQPMNCSPQGFSVHGILQARILECIAIPFSRGSSRLKDRPWSHALQADSLPFELQGSPLGDWSLDLFHLAWGQDCGVTRRGAALCEEIPEASQQHPQKRLSSGEFCHHLWETFNSSHFS